MKGNNITCYEEQIANMMNIYFINVTKTLNLKKQLGVRRSGVNEFDNHISIKMIQNILKYFQKALNFSFSLKMR